MIFAVGRLRRKRFSNGRVNRFSTFLYLSAFSRSVATYLRAEQFDDRRTSRLGNGGAEFDRQQRSISRNITRNERQADNSRTTNTAVRKTHRTKTVSMAASDIRHFCSQLSPADGPASCPALCPALPLAGPRLAAAQRAPTYNVT